MATTVTLKPNAIDLSGSTSGTTTLQASAVAGTTTVTLPAATDTLVGKATTDTLTNKTLTSPTMTAPVLGTPASGTVTNLTGTASININGTVGATTANTGAFTTGSFTKATAGDSITFTNAAASNKTGYLYTDASSVGMFTGANASGTALGVYMDVTASAIYGAIGVSGNKLTLTSTGLNSTVIGATTPAAGSFTTLSASGATNITGGNWLQFASTNTLYSSSGVGFFLQAPDVSTTPLTIRGGGGATWASFTSTGLAVTGAISATGNGTFTGSSVYGGGSYIQIAPSSTDTNSLTVRAAGNITGTISGTDRITVSSTGLAVTGTLSATGEIKSESANSTGLGGRILLSNTGSQASGTAADIAFRCNSNFTATYYSARIANVNTGADSLSDLVFSLYDNGLPSGTEKLRITNAGVLDLAAGQIKFPATQNASANANTLDDYEEYTAASAACVGAITVAAIWKATKIGNTVTLTLPQTIGSATAVAYFYYGVGLPADFRPSANTVFPAMVYDNGGFLDALGTVVVTSAGTINVYRTPTGGANFTNGANAGLAYSTAVSWTI